MLNKLYTSTARYNTITHTLISYSTEVVHFDTCGDWMICAIYRASMTTMEHIRKYVKLLADEGFREHSNLLAETYRWSIMNKSYDYSLAYNSETGEVLAVPAFVRDADEIFN